MFKVLNLKQKVSQLIKIVRKILTNLLFFSCFFFIENDILIWIRMREKIERKESEKWIKNII